MSYERFICQDKLCNNKKENSNSYDTSGHHQGCPVLWVALGSRFESYRPDSSKPINTREFPRLSFLLFSFSNEKKVARSIASKHLRRF